MARIIKKRNSYLYMFLIALTLKLKVVNAINIEQNIQTTKTINNSVMNSNTIILIISIFIGILLLIIMFKTLFNSKIPTTNGLTDEEIKKIDSNLTNLSIKEEVFSLYKKLETAKTKQNYTILKEILSEELYLEQEKELKELKLNKQKLVATNIHLKNAKVLAIQKKKEKTIIMVYLHVSQYDYVINKQKQVIRGTDQTDYQIEYKLTLEQQPDKHFTIKKKTTIYKSSQK